MDGLWIFLSLCLLSSFLRLDVTGRPNVELLEEENSTTEGEEIESSSITTPNNEVDEIQLFPVTSNFPGQTRQPRKFFYKLHTGAAFLTGFKLGNILGKKGFELGSGQITSAHNFQLFGKQVNSAMSLSYGNSDNLLPLVENEQETDEKKRLRKSPLKEDVFLVTVIENSSVGTTTKSEDTISGENKEEINGGSEISGELKARSGIVKLYQEAEKEGAKKSFLEKHNDLVKKVNENIIRRNNSKF